MTVYKKVDGLFYREEIEVSLKSIVDDFKSGKAICIVGEFEEDLTKEELLKYVCRKRIPVEFFATLISDDDLESIVFAGDYDTWNSRLRRGR